MTNFETNVVEKLNKIISLLEDKEVKKPLELEDYNFKINSDGWQKITVDGKMYLQNKEKDVWEFLEGEYKGEQLFTFDSAIRETKKAGKLIPTDNQLRELLKEKEDLKNIKYTGYRDTGSSFTGLGSGLSLWSSSPSGSSSAWNRCLNSFYSTVSRYAFTRAYGFSVRCLKSC